MTTANTTNPRRDSDTVHGLVLPFDLAFIRWAVVCRSWGDIANGHAPLLVAFLAGWCCRCIAADQPMNMGQFRDSYRAGWREADDQITIHRRQNKERSGLLSGTTRARSDTNDYGVVCG